MKVKRYTWRVVAHCPALSRDISSDGGPYESEDRCLDVLEDSIRSNFAQGRKIKLARLETVKASPQQKTIESVERS